MTKLYYPLIVLIYLTACQNTVSETQRDKTTLTTISEDDLYNRLAGLLLSDPTTKYEIESNKLINTALDSLWNVQKLESGLFYEILNTGYGDSIVWADRLKVHYEGRFLNGDVFDTSYKRNKPFEFYLGKVIDGWNEGLELIKVGGKIRLLVPSHLGYGERGFIIASKDTLVPPDEPLIFTIEVLDKL